jgi:hypothetical protein
MTDPSPISGTVRLDDLIAVIRKVHDDPLEQLHDAAMAAEHLGELADHLVGHFVDQARRSGASWTDIGRSMGVTKQAVQKRFVPRADDTPIDDTRNFARFTQRARNVVVTAQEEARRHRNSEITPAHLVLGLLAEPEGLAAKAIVAAAIPLDDVRAAATSRLPDPADDVPALIPFDGHARKVLELTFRHALRLGHNYVGTEHLLLALLEHEGDDGVLAGLGIDRDEAEANIAQLLAKAGA